LQRQLNTSTKPKKGKFYEEISKKWFQVEGFTYKGKDDLKHIVINTGELWSILDAAKKDYPKFPTIDETTRALGLPINSMPKSIMEEQREMLHSTLKDNWFKKWFGASANP
jgi:hypothetical protein